MSEREVELPMSPEVSLHFLHAGEGQSVLIELTGDRWLVVDASKSAGNPRNAALAFLSPRFREPSFRILAVVVTHFHEDHYGGVVEILEACQKEAESRGLRLADLVEGLILPSTYDEFYGWLAGRTRSRGEGDLERRHLVVFLDQLERFRAQGVRVDSFRPPSFGWKDGTSEGLEAGQAWLFAYYPPRETSSERRFQKVIERGGVAPTEVQAFAAELQQENRSSAVLGVGVGREVGDLQFLLTSDIPGSTFGEVTKALRKRLPELGRWTGTGYSELGAGADRELAQLVVPDRRRSDSPPRLRPLDGSTVAHHGSPTAPVQSEDLDWWLREERDPKARPAFAVVQGQGKAMGDETLRQLQAARMCVFTSSYPDRIAGAETTWDLDERLPKPPGKASPEPQASAEAPGPVTHLTVQGGSGGVQWAYSRGFFEIRPRNHVVPCPDTEIFRAAANAPHAESVQASTS